MDQDCQLYIGDLDNDVVESDLYQIAQKFGEVAVIRVIRNLSQQQKHRGYGFITFKSASDADLARREMNGMKIKTKHVRVMKYIT